jgi:hypothetical protein
MVPIRFLALLSAGLALSLMASAVAQPTPAKPTVVEPSAFAGYRAFSAKSPPVSWREANDLAQRLDGHMGQVRGAPRARQTDAVPPAKPDAPHPHEMKKP